PPGSSVAPRPPRLNGRASLSAALAAVNALAALSVFVFLLSPSSAIRPRMSIVAVGSIALDTIKTPFGQADDVVGGSLTYFAIASSYFPYVNLLAPVRRDATPPPF